MNWAIQPGFGTGDLHFRMMPDDVAGILGPPDKISETRSGHRVETRSVTSPKIEFDTDGIVELVFFRFVVSLELDGLRIFRSPPDEVLRLLWVRDPGLLEWYGSIVSLQAGLLLTNFHDGDPDLRSVTQFRNGVRTADSLPTARPIHFY